MDILHRLSTARAAAGREGLIYHALARLDARALADLGVDRAEIRSVARLGARSGPGGVDLREVLAQVRAGQADATSEPLTGLAAIAADLWRAAAASDLGRSDPAPAALAPRLPPSPRRAAELLAARADDRPAAQPGGDRRHRRGVRRRARRGVRRGQPCLPARGPAPAGRRLGDAAGTTTV